MLTRLVCLAHLELGYVDLQAIKGSNHLSLEYVREMSLARMVATVQQVLC